MSHERMATYLQHSMPIFLQCTLLEVAVLGITSLGLTCGLFGLLGWILASRFLLGAIIGVIVSYIPFRLFVALLSRAKQDKPYGYYQQWLLLKLMQHGVIKADFHTYQGPWSIGRHDA